jgi:hypothetical protein
MAGMEGEREVSLAGLQSVCDRCLGEKIDVAWQTLVREEEGEGGGGVLNQKPCPLTGIS